MQNLLQEELEKFLGELSKYEGGTSPTLAISEGALRVLSAITSAVSVLSIAVQRMAFQYFSLRRRRHVELRGLSQLAGEVWES